MSNTVNTFITKAGNSINTLKELHSELVSSSIRDVAYEPRGLWVRTREGIISKILTEKAKETNECITAHQSLSIDRYIKQYTVVYSPDRDSEIVDVEINYMILFGEIPDELNRDEIVKDVCDYFKSIDTVTKTNEGFIVDVNKDRVLSYVYYGSSNYRVIAIKEGANIEVMFIEAEIYDQPF